MTHDDDLTTLAKLTKKARVGVLTTVDAHGNLVSRPLAMQDIDFEGDLWFFTQDPSPKVEDITGNPHVNVSFEADTGWVSIAGTAEVSRDQAMIDKLWNKFAEAWFEQGREDPSVALLKVSAETAEFWSTDQPRALQLLNVAKAVVTGGSPDIGESKTVQL